MNAIDWCSERMVFGIAAWGTFLALALAAIVFPLDASRQQIARDCLLVVGPLLGMISQAVWKADKTDRLNATTAATLAAALPPPPAPPPPPPPPQAAP